MNSEPNPACTACHGRGMVIVSDVSPGGSPDIFSCGCADGLCNVCGRPPASRSDGLCGAHRGRT